MARKPTKATAERFMNKLMEPLPDTDFSDYQLKRMEMRARAEARDRQHTIWMGGQWRAEMAEHRYKALDAAGLAHRDGALPDAPNEAELATAYNAWGEEIDRQIQIPARTKDQLGWKKKNARYATDRRHVPSDKPATMTEFADALFAYCKAAKGEPSPRDARKAARAEAIARDEVAIANAKTGGRT